MDNYPKSLISVIIPAYNTEDYIERAVETVRKQTFENLEILIIDDGSTDNTGIKADKIGLLDDRVKVIHKTNGGLSDAMNLGLDIAQGDYIAFLDSDDAYHPRFLEILLDALLKNDCDIAQCEFYMTHNTDDHLFDMSDSKCELMNGMDAALKCAGEKLHEYIVAWNKLYKRNVLEGIRYPLGEINEDQFMTWRVFLNAGKVVYVRTFLYVHLQRRGSLMGSRYSRRHLQVIEAYIERSRFFHDKGYDREALFMMRWAKDWLLDGIEKLSNQNEDVSDLEKKGDLIEIELKKREEDFYKFPYELIDEGKKVVIYGAGMVGMAYYRQLLESSKYGHFLIVDKFAIRGRDEVESIDHIFDYKDAYIVIALENPLMASEVRDMLQRMGIDDDRIIWKVAPYIRED